NIFFTDDRKPNVHVQQTEIPAKLRTMVDLLVDEEARQGDTTAGVCMEYFLKNGILQYLVNEAEKQDYPMGFRGETIRMIANMVDLLDDRFLVHNAVHKPTVKLLRFCVLDNRQSELYNDDLVDLMYIICSKIHGFPALLNIFFHDTHWLTTPQRNKERRHPLDTDDQQQKPPEYEFLLFTYLLRFVHREGQSGDYARTGLLFLMEMAKDQLGEFILVSDFATIMAAGLGALYSQLPRKLIVKDEDSQQDSIGFILSQHSTEPCPVEFPLGIGMEYSSSPEFKYQLDSFLKLLEFCQDVLTRCPNEDICLYLLSNVQTIFLENILYPSILECSDTDGSSVAVLSYIDLILQTVLQEDLAKVIVGSLMHTDQPISDEEMISARMRHLEINQVGQFTLRDLIFSRLRSNSEPAVIATLKLLKTLIVHHCRYALCLLVTEPELDHKPTPVSHHLREVELYFSLIVAIDSSHAAYGYEGYLRDMESHMDTDDCYQKMHDRKLSGPRFKRRRSFKYGQRRDDPQKEASSKPISRHRLCSSDPLLKALLNLLSNFFTQSTEINLALTGVITVLALCPYRSLEGWIAFSESDRTGPDDVLILNAQEPIKSQDIYAHFEATVPVNEDDEEDDRSIDFGAERGSDKVTRPTFFKSYPSFFTLLRTLIQQMDYYRADIPLFEALLEERRNLLIHGELNPSLLRTHLEKTESLRIQPLFPSHFMSQEPIMDLNDEDEHTFVPKTEPSKANKRVDKSTEITLSMLLNNVVILEESIKEIVALIQVRRSLGIDKVAY
ncbi:hypothetical protein CU098_001490, partial [Rhizopus stolonifer]